MHTHRLRGHLTIALRKVGVRDPRMGDEEIDHSTTSAKLARCSGCQLKQVLTRARPKLSQRHRLCTHNLDYVSNDLRLSTIEEFQKRSGREVRKRVRVEPSKSKKNLHYLQIFVNYIYCS